jgi:hypothetical protein
LPRQVGRGQRRFCRSLRPIAKAHAVKHTGKPGARDTRPRKHARPDAEHAIVIVIDVRTRNVPDLLDAGEMTHQKQAECVVVLQGVTPESGRVPRRREVRLEPGPRPPIAGIVSVAKQQQFASPSQAGPEPISLAKNAKQNPTATAPSRPSPPSRANLTPAQTDLAREVREAKYFRLHSFAFHHFREPSSRRLRPISLAKYAKPNTSACTPSRLNPILTEEQFRTTNRASTGPTIDVQPSRFFAYRRALDAVE